MSRKMPESSTLKINLLNEKKWRDYLTLFDVH